MIMNKLADYNPSRFKGILIFLIPLIIKEIVKSRNISEEEAFYLLYSSKVYETLEDESAKLWHFSPLTLANLLNEELETGKITFPEET
jgi:hypothetical protein